MEWLGGSAFSDLEAVAVATSSDQGVRQCQLTYALAAPADVPAELDAQLDAIRRECRDRAFKALQPLASVTIEIIIERRGIDLTLGWSLDDRHVTDEHQLASAKIGAG